MVQALKSHTSLPVAAGAEREGKEQLNVGAEQSLARDRVLAAHRLWRDRRGGNIAHPLRNHPLATMLYTADGHMSAQLAKPGPYADDQEPTAYAIAYSGPYDVDERAGIVAHTVAHRVQGPVIPSWLGTTQVRQVEFPEAGAHVLSAEVPSRRDGVPSTTTITWSRQPPW
jgi:hypothetical protein